MQGILKITTERREFLYELKEIPCEIGGRGFELRRLDGMGLYHVHLESQSRFACDCMGYLSHGMCKHVRGLKAVFEGIPSPNVMAVLVS